MSNKTQLQTNNTALDGYIARINAAKEVAAGLPEAGGSGGGGSIETCNVSIDDYYNVATLYYTDIDMTHKTLTGHGTVSVPVNTIVALTISSPNTYYVPNGNFETIYTYTNHGALKVYGGCVITIYNMSGGGGA